MRIGVILPTFEKTVEQAVRCAADAEANGTLREQLQTHGFSVGDLEAIWLTHIHMDHAGASGALVRENPRLSVYVHRVGAPHMADPSKLMKAAE